MSDQRKTPTSPTPQTPDGDRIAKVIARAGRASRREAERLINEGRVSVNGKVIDSPALNVTARDRVSVDGVLLDPPEDARLWLYHKPTGLVTTNSDEKGRETIFDQLPEDMPRVMTVGRLDLNSEGLLLLTNDGGIKRKLELPSTGWLRRYRVRVNGRPQEATLDPLRKGIEVEGEKFQPMIVDLDRQQGANAWLTVGLREGKNREIRRAMSHIGLTVNRLIRVSYGPFQLGDLKAGEVQEVRRRVMRDQLGLEAPAEDKPKPTGRKPRPDRKPGRKPGQNMAGKPGKPVGNYDKPSGRSGQKPGVKTPAKPGGRPAGKPGMGTKSGPGGRVFKSGGNAPSKGGPRRAR
jgi:23S rRNA pseudouridine2605 synthase